MIVDINKILDKKKALITAQYCTSRLKLTNLKSMCYSNVCADCTSDGDKYARLSCNKCGKNKFKFCKYEGILFPGVRLH